MQTGGGDDRAVRGEDGIGVAVAVQTWSQAAGAPACLGPAVRAEAVQRAAVTGINRVGQVEQQLHHAMWNRTLLHAQQGMTGKVMVRGEAGGCVHGDDWLSCCLRLFYNQHLWCARKIRMLFWQGCCGEAWLPLQARSRALSSSPIAAAERRRSCAARQGRQMGQMAAGNLRQMRETAVTLREEG